MAATVFKIGQKSTATVEFLDVNNNPAPVQGVPQWESTNSSAFTVTPSADGLSAEVECVGLGPAQIKQTANADLDPGETRELITTGDVDGKPEEAVSSKMVFTAPA